MRNYIKGLNKFYSDKVNRALILIIIFLIVGFSFFQSFVVNRAQSVFVNQMLRKEELAVSSGVDSIKVFLDMAENSLLLLSRSPSVVNQDTEIQKALDKFAVDWAGTPVLGVARFDKDGQVRFMSYNIGGTHKITEGFTATSRDYFTWAKTAPLGNTYLSKPLIPEAETVGFGYIIPYVTSMYRNDEFDGILLLAISLPKLTETYIDPLKVSPNCRVYLIHPDGTILAGLSEYKDYVGLNYFEYIQDNPYSGSDDALQGLRSAVENKSGGRLDIILYSIIEKQFTRFIIAYGPVVYDGEHWTLGVAVPINDILTTLNPLRESSIVMLSLFITVVLIMSAIVILLAKINQRNGYLSGLKDGKKNKT